MPDPNELTFITATGKDLDEAVFLGALHDEIFGQEHFEVQAFAFDGGKPVHAGTLPVPFMHAWRAPDGTAHCPSTEGRLLRIRGVQWEEERVSDADETFGEALGFVDGRGDVARLFVVGEAALYEKRDGLWQPHAWPKEVTGVTCLHGTDPDDVFVATDEGLLRWRGGAFEWLEPVDDDVMALLVRDDGTLVAVGERIHVRGANGGWRALMSPTEESSIGRAIWRGDAFVASDDGLLRIRGDEVALFRGEGVGTLVPMPSALLVFGSDGGIWTFDGDDLRSLL